MQIIVLKRKEIQKIKDLISVYEFSNYRAYRTLCKGKLDEYLFNQISSLLKDNNGCVIIVCKEEKILGLAALVSLSWDTKHFGFGMAKIDYLMARGNYAEAINIKNKLLSFLFGICENKKIVHLSCRIDVNDISSIHALEKNGFELMDTLVTYTFNRHKHKIPKIKDIYRVREFKEQDLSILVDISKNAFSKDRFHLDANIPNKKADDLFGEWIKNCCRGEYADKVFVAIKGNQPIGFLTFRLNEELKKLTGYKICGRGLIAVSPEVKGVLPALAKTAVQEIVLNYDCLEFDTRLNNYEVIKVCQRFGFDFIRANYTFHKRLRN